MVAHPADVLEDIVHALLAEALALAAIDLAQGVVEAVGAVVRTAAPGEKVFDFAPGGDEIPFVDQRPVGKRQAVQVLDVGADGVGDNAARMPVAVAAEGPVVQFEHGGATAIAQGIHQVHQRGLALTAADAVHALLLDHFGEEGRVRPTEHGKDAGQLGFDPPVDVQVVALRAGDDRISNHVGLHVAGDRHRVVVGSHGKFHLVSRCLEGTGQVHNALGLVVDLLSDKQDTHG